MVTRRRDEDATPAIAMRGDIAVVRIDGQHTFSESVRRVADALSHCGARGLRQLVVVATTIEGLQPPSVAARHSMVRDWARAAGGRVRMALVMRPEFIDPERFGMVAAANFGLAGAVFTCEDDAVEWLQLHA